MGMELSAEREKRKLKQMLRGFWGALVQYVIVWMITLCCSVYIYIYIRNFETRGLFNVLVI